MARGGAMSFMAKERGVAKIDTARIPAAGEARSELCFRGIMCERHQGRKEVTQGGSAFRVSALVWQAMVQQ